METNWLAVLVAALVPTVIGFIWYNPKVFGNAWMKAADMTEEKIKGGNMPLIFGLSFLLSLMLAFITQTLVIHQMSLPGLFVPSPGPEADEFLQTFIEKYGTLHRTFTHGTVHGVLFGLFLVMPILATNAMFERKGFKYIAINAGYWIVTLALMGGILCAWMP